MEDKLATPKTYRLFPEETELLNELMTARGMVQQSEYVRHLLWNDAFLHSDPGKVKAATRTRPGPKQAPLPLVFTPRVRDWAYLRTLLEHYARVELAAHGQLPSWAEHLLAEKPSSSTNDEAPPATCCSNPMVAAIGLLLVCDSCSSELAPIAAAAISVWRAAIASKHGNGALAREYERQARNFRQAAEQETKNQELRRIRQSRGREYAKGCMFLDVNAYVDDDTTNKAMGLDDEVDIGRLLLFVCIATEQGKAVSNAKDIAKKFGWDAAKVDRLAKAASDRQFIACYNGYLQLTDSGLTVAENMPRMRTEVEELLAPRATCDKVLENIMDWLCSIKDGASIEVICGELDMEESVAKRVLQTGIDEGVVRLVKGKYCMAWPYDDAIKARDEVCTVLKSGPAKVAAIATALARPALNTLSALEMAQDAGLVKKSDGADGLWSLSEGVIESPLREPVTAQCSAFSSTGLQCALREGHARMHEAPGVEWLDDGSGSVAPVASKPSTSPKKKKPRTAGAVAPAGAVPASSSCLSDASAKPPSCSSLPTDKDVVRRRRNRGARKNVTHIVSKASLKDAIYAGLCGESLLGAAMPRANSVQCPRCEEAFANDAALAARESDLFDCSEWERYWDGIHDVAHTRRLAPFFGNTYVACCNVVLGSTENGPKCELAPPRIRDCSGCARTRKALGKRAETEAAA